jgi:hypothetical protein
MFGFVEGVVRWTSRVTAYAFTLVTDEYPPFRLARNRARRSQVPGEPAGGQAEVDQDHLPAQAVRCQRRRIEPPRRAVKGGQFAPHAQPGRGWCMLPAGV